MTNAMNPHETIERTPAGDPATPRDAAKIQKELDDAMSPAALAAEIDNDLRVMIDRLNRAAPAIGKKSLIYTLEAARRDCDEVTRPENQRRPR